MKIWTFQPIEVYEQLMNTGKYIVDPEKSPLLQLDDHNRWHNAYNWMINQMKQKIGSAPEGVTYPMWAWYRWNDKHQPPDFYDEKTVSKTVCIKLNIPDDEVLLSEFDNWHIVLAQDYISSATNDKDYDKDFEWIESLSKQEVKKEIENSWQKVFDITLRDGAWTLNGYFVQACFWQLKKEQICKVWLLEKGRKTYRLV